jgi:hypothetical protein
MSESAPETVPHIAPEIVPSEDNRRPAEPEAIPATATVVEEQQPASDLERPAFLRRERRLFQ